MSVPYRHIHPLYVYASARYPYFIKYEPETIMAALDFDHDQCTKIIAAQVALDTSRPLEEPFIFEKFVLLANDRSVDMTTHQDLEPTEVCWGLATLRHIDPVTPLDRDVVIYIATHLYNDGVIKVPEFIQHEKTLHGYTIQNALDELNNTDTVLTPKARQLQEVITNRIKAYVTTQYTEYKTELNEVYNDSTGT